MPGKYTPLENYLRSIPETQKEVTLTFEKIEMIINDKLPPSAYEYPAWWLEKSQGSHVQSNTWLNAGCRVDTVNLSEKWVRFVKVQ